jgi:hypothetical protein
MKCSGIKCATNLLSTNPVIPGVAEMDLLMTGMRQPVFDAFSFKESDSKIRNLRGN